MPAAITPVRRFRSLLRPPGQVVAMALALAPILAAAGCAGVDPVPGSSCAGDADLAGIDWAAAQPVAVEIRDGDFAPMVFAFVRDRPYVLTISNADSGSREFRAPDFFRTIAVESATVGADAAGDTCLTGLTVPALGRAEVQFVALRNGRYDLADGILKTAVPGYESGRGLGAIYVD